MGGGSKDEDDEEQPAWLDTDNDEQHRQEVEPLLFGTGTMNFADPEENEDEEEEHDDDDDDEPDDETDLETAVLSAASGNSKKTYGSTSPATTTGKSSKSTSSPATKASTNKKKLVKAKNKLWPFLSNSDESKKKKQKKTKSNRRLQETQEDYDDDDPWPSSKSRISYNTKTGRPERPYRDWCLNVYYFVETCAILTCLCLLVSQTLPLVLIPLKEIEPVDMVLKIYISLFSILFMIVEYDLAIPFVRQSVFLQTYSSRGFLYSFLGLTCLEEAYSERVNDMLAHANEKFHVAWFALFLQVSAWSLCLLGVLYFVMGLFCLKRVRDRLVKQDREKWKEYREALKEWQKNHSEDD